MFYLRYFETIFDKCFNAIFFLYILYVNFCYNFLGICKGQNFKIIEVSGSECMNNYWVEQKMTSGRRQK